MDDRRLTVLREQYRRTEDYIPTRGNAVWHPFTSWRTFAVGADVHWMICWKRVSDMANQKPPVAIEMRLEVVTTNSLLFHEKDPFLKSTRLHAFDFSSSHEYLMGFIFFVHRGNLSFP